MRLRDFSSLSVYKHAQIPTIAERGIVVLTNTTKQYPVNSLGDLVGTPETNFVCFSISDKPSELHLFCTEK